MTRRVQMVPGTFEAVAAIRRGPVVALDIGTGAKPSTGLASAREEVRESTCLTVGSALERTIEELSGGGTLILEAPLSGLRTARRSPVGRHFESKRINGRKQVRYWYSGSGPDVALAAIIFLRDLLDALASRPGKNVVVNVYEGFLTFKEKATAHRKDAEKLRDALLDGAKDSLIEVKSTQEVPVSLLRAAGLTTDPRPPLVVAP